MVTAVGMTAPAACAAMRAGINNPTETRYVDAAGEWLLAQQVPLEESLRGRARVVRLAAMAVAESMSAFADIDSSRIPLLLCIAENTRKGRLGSLDGELLLDVQRLLGAKFSAASRVIAAGRVGVALALLEARKLLRQHDIPAVIVAGADSLISAPMLEAFERESRLMTSLNSNGFIAGEAASSLLLGRPVEGRWLLVEGIGLAREAAHIDSGEPLRGNGLVQAIRAALDDAACELHDLDFRITDLSGEQYYFKEAALALTRSLKQRKDSFDLWHPAQFIGETGSAIGPAILGVAEAACRKGYAAGPSILCHLGNDGGERAAIVARYRVL
jgi:3-oxoacyl-[acyl-carrier-protein] synthase-1